MENIIRGQQRMSSADFAVILFNLIFLGHGVSLIRMGVKSMSKYSEYYSSLIEYRGGSAQQVTFFGIGVLIILIAILGFYGYVAENYAVLMSFSALIGVTLVFQVGCALAAHQIKPEVETRVERSLHYSLGQYYQSGWQWWHPSKTIESWNVLQSELHCCGVSNYTDWGKVVGRPEKSFIPEFCCREGKTDLCTLAITQDNLENVDFVKTIIYTEGCVEKAKDLIFVLNHIDYTFGGILLGIHVLGIIAAGAAAQNYRFSYGRVPNII